MRRSSSTPGRYRIDPATARCGGTSSASRSAPPLHHYTRGRRYAGLGHYDEALLEYQIAAQLNPASGEILDALRTMRRAVQTKLVARTAGQTELESLIERTRTLPAAGLELPDSTLPDSLVSARPAHATSFRRWVSSPTSTSSSTGVHRTTRSRSTCAARR